MRKLLSYRINPELLKRKRGKLRSKPKKVTIVHSYEDRPKHLRDPLKYPDPNEIVPASKAPSLDKRKKIFPCGNPRCRHDSRDHRALPNPSIGHTAGVCSIRGCKCKGYKFTGKVTFGNGKKKIKLVGHNVYGMRKILKKGEKVSIEPVAKHGRFTVKAKKKVSRPKHVADIKFHKSWKDVTTKTGKLRPRPKMRKR